MGIDSVWQDFIPQEKSLKQFLVDFIRDFNRRPRLAIDAYQWMFQIESNKYGAELKGFVNVWIRRLLMFVSLGYDILVVFDGPSRPRWKRGSIRIESSIYEIRVELAKRVLESLGIPYEQAPGEAEAECAVLQQEQVVDYVFSTDADTLLFGATKVMFFQDQIPSDTSDSDGRWIKIIERDSEEHPRSEYLLRVLLSGGDYDPTGISGLGPKIAREASKQSTGFSQELVSIYNNEWSEIPRRNPLPQDAEDSFDEIDNSNGNDPFEADYEQYDGERQLLFDNWRFRLNHQLHTNELGFFSQKHPSINIPDTFPDCKLLHRYCFPLVNEYSLGFISEFFRPNLIKLYDVLTQFNALLSPPSSQEDLEPIDWNLWKAADILLIPCFISHISNGSDKISWYNNIRRKKRKIPRDYSEYVISIEPEHYREILGISISIEFPRLKHDQVLLTEEILFQSKYSDDIEQLIKPATKPRPKKRQIPKNNMKITDFFSARKPNEIHQKNI